MEINELISKARGGDCEAFAEAFEQYRALLYAVACRTVGYSDADDVIMDTYLKAWRSLPRFRGDAALKTWLMRVFHSCSTDFLRRRAREQARLAPERQDDGSERGPLSERVPEKAGASPDAQAHLTDLGIQLDQALAELSAEHRAAVLLREVDGLSYHEIAKTTGVGTGTVMSRLFYAKRKLRRILKNKGIGQ